MRLPGRILVVLLPLLLAAAPASAQLISDDWQCGQPIVTNAALLAHFTPSHAFSGQAGLPSFVTGTVKSEEGETLSVVFIHGATDWQGYAVQHQAGFTNVYAASDGKRAVLFSMVDVEGPGQTYTVVSTEDGFQHLACGELPAPATKLDTLDYMSITSLELAADGYGQLQGRVDFSEGRAPECFSADTKDGGKTWSVPEPVKSCIASIVSPVDQAPAANDPVSDLRSSFK